MQVMIVRPGEAVPEIKEIDNRLEEYQAIVGGYIETHRVIPGVMMLFNEEGLLRNLPPNRVILVGNYPVTIRGTIIISGYRVTAEGNEFCDLRGEKLDQMREMWTGSIYLAPLPEKKQ